MEPLSLPQFKEPLSLFICVKEDSFFQSNLALALESCFENVQHKIDEIIVVSPSHPSGLTQNINYFSDKKFISMIRERNSDSVPEHAFIFGNNWLRQQVFKLHAELVCKNDEILLLDPDLVFLQPVSFANNGCRFFYLDDEHYEPYFKTIEDLLGIPRQIDSSFIVDHQVVNRHILNHLRKEVCARHRRHFLDILSQVVQENSLGLPIGALSEYELYGNYIFKLFGNDRIVFRKNRSGQCRHLVTNSRQISLQDLKRWNQGRFAFIPLRADDRQEGLNYIYFDS